MRVAAAAVKPRGTTALGASLGRVAQPVQPHALVVHEQEQQAAAHTAAGRVVRVGGWRPMISIF